MNNSINTLSYTVFSISRAQTPPEEGHSITHSAYGEMDSYSY